MAQEEITIIIVGKDAASKIFKSVGKEAEATGKKIESKLGDALTRTGKAATKTGKIMSVGVTAPLLLFGKTAVDGAIKAERLTNTLEGLAGGSENAARYIEAIKTASLGTISQVDALAIANRALSFEIVKSGEEMEQLTTIAMTLGRAQGLTATQAMSDFATALSRNSPMILDNLGITLKLSEAHLIYADSIGKSVDKLTEEEKALAFREAALIKGMDKVKEMGGVQDDAAASGERMKAQIKDMSLIVGQSLIPVMSQTISVVTPVVKAFTDLDPATQKLVIQLGLVAAAAGPVIGIVGKITSAIGSMSDSIGNANKRLKEFEGISAGTALSVGAGIAVVTGLALAYKLLEDNLESGKQAVLEALDVYTVKMREAAIAGEGIVETAENAGKAVEREAEAWEKRNAIGSLWTRTGERQKDAMAKLHLEIVSSARDYAEYEKAVLAANENVSDSTAKIREQSYAAGRSGRQIARVSNELLKLSEMEFALANNTDMVARSMHGFVDSFATTSEVARDATQHTREYWDQQRNSVYMVDEEVSAVQRLALTHEEEMDRRREMIRLHSDQANAAAAAEERIAAHAERAMGIQDRQRALAEANTAAYLNQKAAAEDLARSQASLMTAMQGATEEQFKQKVFAEVDPASLGIEAYASLGVELGLLDENAKNLALSIGPAVEAIEGGKVPIEDAGELMADLYEAAGDANPEIEGILEKYLAMPEALTPTNEQQQAYLEKMQSMGEEVLPTAVEQTDAYGTSLEDLKSPADEAYDAMDSVREVLLAIEGTHTVHVNYTSAGTPPGYQGARQMGGVIDQEGLYYMHAGEVVLNPYQPGAMGGPGGPSPPPSVSHSYGGDTFHVTITDQLAAAMFLEQQRQRRLNRLNARM